MRPFAKVATIGGRPWAGLAAWSLLGVIALVTLGPQRLRPHLTQDPQVERALAFFALSGAFTLAYPRSKLTVLAGVVTGAAALEFMQLLVPGRHAEVRDAASKIVGGALGVWAASVIEARV